MTAPNVMRLGWLAQTNTYSGKIYSVKPLGGAVYDYTVFAYGVDSLGHRTTQSLNLDFDSYVGDLFLATAMAGNAFPTVNVTAPSEVSINDNVTVNLSPTDNFGGTILTKQVRFNGGAWLDANNGSAATTAPSTVGGITWDVRVLDNDSNMVMDSGTIQIVKPQLNVLINKNVTRVPIDSLVTLSVDFNVSYGYIDSVFWDLDVGFGWEEKTLKDSIIQIKWNTAGIKLVKVRIVNQNGEVATDSLYIDVHDDAQEITPSLPLGNTIYKVKKYGNVFWFTENLKDLPFEGASYCQTNDSNCNYYGRLYDSIAVESDPCQKYGARAATFADWAALKQIAVGVLLLEDSSWVDDNLHLSLQRALADNVNWLSSQGKDVGRGRDLLGLNFIPSGVIRPDTTPDKKDQAVIYWAKYTDGSIRRTWYLRLDNEYQELLL